MPGLPYRLSPRPETRDQVTGNLHVCVCMCPYL